MFLNLFQIINWPISTESMEFSSIEDAVLAEENSKGNQSGLDVNIRWHMPVILKHEDVTTSGVKILRLKMHQSG